MLPTVYRPILQSTNTITSHRLPTPPRPPGSITSLLLFCSSTPPTSLLLVIHHQFCKLVALTLSKRCTKSHLRKRQNLLLLLLLFHIYSYCCYCLTESVLLGHDIDEVIDFLSYVHTLFILVFIGSESNHCIGYPCH